MEEFTRAGDALVRAASPETRREVIEVVAALRSVLRKMQGRIEQLEIRQGKLASEAANQAAQTTIDLNAPLAQEIAELKTDLQALTGRVEQLEAREVSAAPKE